MSFNNLGLSPHISKSILKLGYLKPFRIQSETIPIILKGEDVIGIASTGSGKTLCFVAPVLQKIQHQPYNKSREIKSLVLVPTRELSIQIEQVFNSMQDALRRRIKVQAVYGGTSINPQMKNLYGTEILISTPGRLLDLMDHNALTLDSIQHLIIDEADKMFQLGFENEMMSILKTVPKVRQTILFSATMNDKVEKIKKILCINPTIIEAEKESINIEQIEQIAYNVSSEHKGPFLRYLIKSENLKQILVFVSSIRTADNLVHKLTKNKISAMAIHSKKSQSARIDNLEDFKLGDIQVLVSTDLIGRGIHIEDLPLVVNYELPRSPLDYIHRIGRTGRANSKGKAISLVTEEDLHHFKIIQKKAGKKIELLSTDMIDLHGY